jgi:hypothetical protein
LPWAPTVGSPESYHLLKDGTRAFLIRADGERLGDGTFEIQISQAHGILIDFTGAAIAVGEVTTPGQQTRAVRWVNDGGDWNSAPFNTPPNVDSTAYGIVSSPADHAIAGSVCCGATCQAVVWRSSP